MQFCDCLMAVTQLAHALTSHWYLLCETEEEGQGLFHTESLRDFSVQLCETRDQITAQLHQLEQKVQTALALAEAGNLHAHTGTLTYNDLCKSMKIFQPYLYNYPQLSAAEAWQRLSDNTLSEHILDQYYRRREDLEHEEEAL